MAVLNSRGRDEAPANIGATARVPVGVKQAHLSALGIHTHTGRLSAHGSAPAALRSPVLRCRSARRHGHRNASRCRDARCGGCQIRVGRAACQIRVGRAACQTRSGRAAGLAGGRAVR